MQRQRERARAASKFTMHSGVEYSGYATEFHGYETLRLEGKIVALYKSGSQVQTVDAGDEAVVVLDRGVYGFRPSYTFTTLGNRRAAPRIRFLDYLDVDGDGRAELFFGLRNPRPQLYTIVLRFENENWREILRFEGNRCQF